jgi:hypothetical protein
VSARRLVFVERAGDASAPAPDTDIVVLDTAWTPAPGDRSDVQPIRPAIWPIIEQVDLFEESLERLDVWAAAADLATQFAVDGTSWWFHARNFLRLDVHEMLLWRRVLEVVAPTGRYDTLVLPAGRANLLAAARAMRPGVGPEGIAVVGAEPAVIEFMRRVRGGVRRRAGRLGTAVLDRLPVALEITRRRALLAGRLAATVAEPPDVLAIVRTASFHRVDGSDGGRRIDPYVTPVLDAIRAEGRQVASFAIGLEYRRDDDWTTIEADPGLLPQSILREAFGAPEDDGIRAKAAARLAAIEVPSIDVDGVDLGPAIHALVAGQARWFERQWRTMVLARRFLSAVRPRVLFTGWEAARTAWLGAARNVAIASVAVQHGVVYPHSPDYYRPLHPTLVRPDVTCVFGPYERDVLVDDGRYDPASVVVTGSPRVDPRGARTPASPDERASVRAELGVAAGDRLLVVSAARATVGDAIHSVTAMARLLDGPLPGIHLVIKVHPEEEGGSQYEFLIKGLARAGGYEPPPVTSVRDVDLYRLLRSADAHLSQYSTTLSDAVLSATPNMVSVGHAWSDILGYTEAGVATPVRSVDDVRAFMRAPQPPSTDRRDRFIEAHYLPGDAIPRIARTIVDAQRRTSKAS